MSFDYFISLELYCSYFGCSLISDRVNISGDFIDNKCVGKQAMSIASGKGEETAQSQDIYSSELLRPTLFVLPSPSILVGYLCFY